MLGCPKQAESPRERSLPARARQGLIAPAAASAAIDALAKRRRVRPLVRQIAARMPLFRGVICTLRRDLGELLELTDTDDGGLFARLDGADRDVRDLLYYASGGEHDAHEPVPARPTACQVSMISYCER